MVRQPEPAPGIVIRHIAEISRVAVQFRPACWIISCACLVKCSEPMSAFSPVGLPLKLLEQVGDRDHRLAGRVWAAATCRCAGRRKLQAHAHRDHDELKTTMNATRTPTGGI
jgi:hypothetical protein